MRRALAFGRRRPLRAPAEATGILAAMVDAVIVVGPERDIRYVNPAAEQLFGTGAGVLSEQRLSDVLPEDCPVFSIIDQVAASGSSVSENGVALESPRTGPRFVSIRAAGMADGSDSVVVQISEQSIARKMDQQLVHRGAARSVSAMAALLAHEVKNPLSGIRGAAQLIEQTLPEGDRELTRLICDETDRICALVDRMEVFTDGRPLDRQAVNIHEVLEHCRKVAQNGFARHLRFTETYDPSLPPALGSRDQLVQVFLNLIKNAAEAAPEAGGEIHLSTAYQHGIRLALPGSESRLQLPLLVRVQDNGEGIPEHLRPNLFDPFVTGKKNGTGLGLALVAKIIGDHGGIIEFDSLPRRTVFRVMLPLHEKGDRG